jgi:hypothetical protein
MKFRVPFGTARVRRSNYEASSATSSSQGVSPFPAFFAARSYRAFRSGVTRQLIRSVRGFSTGGLPLGRFLGCFMGQLCTHK